MAGDPKTVVQRFWDEIWNNRNPAAAEELLAEDFVWQTPSLGTHRGRAQALEALGQIRSAFPDMLLAVEEMIAEDDKVATRWVNTATHRGAYRGVGPTGQIVTWAGMTMHRVVDGRIVEHRAFADTTAPGGPHELATR
ncbi:MAG TPA: ester cyclase [Chloroflexota bacterium]|jgi:steroid delta-isomerase-like uncharacterized protein